MAVSLPTLRKLRLHLEERDGTLRRAASLLLTAGDASLYVVPYAAGGEYFYGRYDMAAGETEATIAFREQISAEQNPKVSIHEGGQVHIYAAGKPRAGPLDIPPLAELRGEHIASVRWDAIRDLPKHEGKTRTTGSECDLAFGVPDDVASGALLIYANGERNEFRTSHVHFAIQKEAMGGGSVFFGFTAAAKEPLGDDGGGVSVLAGFDPRREGDDPASFLFLRGA